MTRVVVSGVEQESRPLSPVPLRKPKAMDYGSVATAALSLSPTERADLAATLLDSLGAPPIEEIESAWRNEIAQRLIAADRGDVRSVPWHKVEAALRQRAEAHDAG